LLVEPNCENVSYHAVNTASVVSSLHEKQQTQSIIV